ncbi:MAG: magnesium/cobalt transporter CorA [Pseudomonadota bacterium]
MINRIYQKFSQKAGLPPGTVVHVGEKKEERTKIDFIRFTATEMFEKSYAAVAEIEEMTGDAQAVTWVHVNGIQQSGLIEEIGRKFNFHALVMEDIVNTGHRPKIDEWDEYFFLVVKSLTYDQESLFVVPAHVSIVFRENVVISFQESGPDLFQALRERIRTVNGRVRKKGADYLLYALLDTIVDGYFSLLEKIGDRVEELEEMALGGNASATFHEIHEIKREMTVIRRSIWPLRDIISRLENNGAFISENTRYYLRDVHDHVVQSIDIVETFRDMLSGLQEIALSLNSNKMNEIMKVLTLIATIFIPLTFIAGVYGMNFKFMPELEWKWGYFAALGFMFVVGCSMGIYFKKKSWL